MASLARPQTDGDHAPAPADNEPNRVGDGRLLDQIRDGEHRVAVDVGAGSDDAEAQDALRIDLLDGYCDAGCVPDARRAQPADDPPGRAWG